MATVKKPTTTKELVEEANANPNYDSMIQYEETMTTVKVAGEPRKRMLQKTPYIDFGGHKLYLNKDEYDAIRAGTLDPQKLIDDIPVEVTYKQ